MITVLFVCLGNICRSPMAEGVFQQLIHDAGLQNQIQTDSAGTSRYHIGEKAHSGTRQILQSAGIPYNGRARQINKAELKDKTTWIIAMDDSNIKNIQRVAKPNQLHKLLDFSQQYPDVRNVPDPYYTGDFDYVFDVVKDGCAGLLQHIRQEEKI